MFKNSPPSLTTRAGATQLTVEQLDQVAGGLNALTVVAAIGVTLGLDVAKGVVLGGYGLGKLLGV